MVNVRKKKNIQTKPCRPSSLLSDLQLNKSEGSSSVASLKTLSNSSKESRKSKSIPGSKTSHDSAKLKHEVVVFVLSKSGAPLMPTRPAKARRMLEKGFAKVVSHTPFVIKMLGEVRDYTQIIDAGLDVGAKKIGVSARVGVLILYAAIVQMRQQEIKGKLDQRRMFRGTRRGRKLRYRQPRFLNRGQPIRIGKHQPSVKHVIDAHVREIRFVESILPVTNWHIETASFDIHKITNPDVIDYQKGRMQGFENVKAYVLHRDSYQCAKSPSHKGKLHVHHIEFKSNGGSDSPDNLIVLCETCHSELHKSKNAQKESLKLRTKQKARTKDATIASTVSSFLKKTLKFTETFGYETKIKRRILGFPKDHHIDALLASCSVGEVVDLPVSMYFKRLVSQGDYQQTSGPRSEKKIPTGKLFGLRKFDLILTSKGIGFVKGKRSSGHFAISSIDGVSISDSVNVKKAAKRLAARKTVLVIRKNPEAQFLPALKDRVSLREER